MKAAFDKHPESFEFLPSISYNCISIKDSDVEAHVILFGFMYWSFGIQWIKECNKD